MKKYIVKLSEAERAHLQTLIAKGKSAARTLTHARILLKADASEGGPAWKDEAIVEALETSVRTVERLRERFVEEGIEAALSRKPISRRPSRKMDGETEAHLIALACSEPPTGRSHWSVRLLANRMVELGYVESVSHECVRQALKKTRSSRG
jgi:transposase